MKDYIVLDLETPNLGNDSISSIGIVIVKDNEVIEEKYSLINPEAKFDSFNIGLTGIHPEDVKDSPTFDEYWTQIKDIVTTNIIVGQNITFDLNVISQTLTRYNLPLPSFDYYCTLNSSRQYLKLDSHALEHLCKNYLKLDYDAHNALEDARVTNVLFNHLRKFDKNPRNHIKCYTYKPGIKRSFDRQLDLNINYLYGLVQRFKYNTEISEKHFDLIKKWYDENPIDEEHALLNNLILKLQHFIQKNPLLPVDMRGLSKSIKIIKISPEYKKKDLLLTALKGIIDSFIVYDEIKWDDVDFLNKWLIQNSINHNLIEEFNIQLDKTLDSGNYDEFKVFLGEYTLKLDKYLDDIKKNYC